MLKKLLEMGSFSIRAVFPVLKLTLNQSVFILQVNNIRSTMPTIAYVVSATRGAAKWCYVFILRLLCVSFNVELKVVQ